MGLGAHCRILSTLLLCATPDAIPLGAAAQGAREGDDTRLTYALSGAPGAQLSDTALEAAVTTELNHDPLIDIERIRVDATDGIISLTGTQPILIARDRATYVAETVRGVRQVINDIKVDSGREVDEQRLEADILYALLTDPATEQVEFTVEATGSGHVVLRGVVDSGAERSIAEKIVKSIAGVRSVTSEVEVSWSPHRPDSEILADIQRMLQWDAYVDSGGMQVSVNDGVVTFTGSVSSAAEKRRAVGLSWVAGVKHVNIVPLDVVAEGPAQRRGAGTMLELRSDKAIVDAVRRALKLDPRLSGADIDVNVSNRAVTLSGSVSNLRAKRVAARTPYGILGVASVRDRLRIDEARVHDDEIERRVQRALAKNAVTSAAAVHVEVQDGAVTLQGAVEDKYSRATAEDLASTVRGVRSITNKLEVDLDAERFLYDPYVDIAGAQGDLSEETTRAADHRESDNPIAENVRRELWWSPFVDADDITVSVDTAVVTLTGTVDSEAERRAAIENAFEGGAVSVRSRLIVRE